eukprot:Blabericola_migrator_1__933@NODE_1231_length_5037_cov_88_565795_g834_i0_p1_GENE_NODE_1231_length_5037_cov_88_565795_g834_i0NODE_1231_length_5037_cov_88_565795_g834_i0_p1_ORF_typecomplete_len669_score67_89SET/PF00856_28/0_0023Abi_C/PF14355_6/0_097TPR_MalT/PF17874_1/0_22TPR_MalT/PF17874_1/90Fis1_TPR_C/PF14853_6/7_9e02Fis1_TPR_C/PF14853_6/1TPR_19/PF14559_6/7_6TPR_19/PF14559_6/2_1e02_NODE_1231_length_5037_cov_88_565795_g834_i01252131
MTLPSPARRAASYGRTTGHRNGSHEELHYPCTQPLHELKPITLDYIRPHKSCAGCVLIVRVRSEPYRASVNLLFPKVEDSVGQVASLKASYLAPPLVYPMSFFWGANDILAVTPPFSWEDSEAGVVIAVDHPSNVHKLTWTDALLPAHWQVTPPNETHSKLRQVALSSNSTFNLIAKLRLSASRAHGHFERGQYHSALLEAKTAIKAAEDGIDDYTILDENVKLCKLAAQATCKFNDYATAKQFVSMALRLKPEDDELQRYLSELDQRYAEQQDGKYDWEMIGRLVMERPDLTLDLANYTSNVRRSLICNQFGLTIDGLFATTAIAAGELILCEAAFAITRGVGEIDYVHPRADLADETFSKTLYLLLHNPSYYKEHCLAYGGNLLFPEKLVDGLPPIRASMIYGLYRYDELSECNLSWYLDGPTNGFWMHASKLRSECIGNAQAIILGNMIVIHATKAIDKDQEIFLSLRPFRPSIKSCCITHCKWCRAMFGDKLDSNIHYTGPRSVAEKALMKFCEDIRRGKEDLSVESIARAEVLRNDLRQFYADQHLSELPKFELFVINQYLAPHTLRLDHPHVRQNALQELADHGYRLIWLPGIDRYKIDDTCCVVELWVAIAAARLFEVHKAAGQHAAAKQMLDFAKQAFKASLGHMNCFAEILNVTEEDCQ